MPIGPTSGFLDFTNATPRANVIIALSNVGVGTDVPLHALDIRGTANVADIIINNDLTLIGGLTTNTLTINSVSMSTTSNFQQVTNVGDAATTNTVQFTNPTTGFTVSSNAEVGGELSVSGNLEVGTANLFVDTTTGNVGVGTTEPTESLDIVGNLNLQKVSNTASIKLNSNVVTEFARSKKLIKYPRVAMTANSSGGYVVSASSFYGNYPPYEAFNNIFPSGHDGGTEGWLSNFTDGAYSATATNGEYLPTGTDTFNGENGSFLKIQLPIKIKLNHLVLKQRYASSGQEYSKNVELYASVDNSTWQSLGTFDPSGSEVFTFYTNDDGYYYDYFVLHFKSVNHRFGYAAVEELEYFGTPEYDPEAHGTDVIMRSVPNVPNADWLEVYYDGQDYTSMPSTVTDKSGNGVTGTPNGNVGFDTEYKAFTFDGSGDFVKGAIPSSLSGNHPYTFSLWIKPDAIQSNFIAVFEMGNRTTNQCCGLYLNGGSVIHLAFGNNLTTSTSVVPNQWIHITGTYTSGSRKIYADGVLLATDTYSSMNIGSTEMTLGANNDDSQEFDGSIANFRLFNRALTGDEIWQLYAYQKEYFDVSMDVVTFKNGGLGIGTSEPKAILDVRGGANFDSAITIGTNIVSSFTGQHMCFPDGDMEQGLIVSANKNKYVSLNGVTTGLGAIRSDESLPIVSLSNVSNDGGVFGVVHELETGGTTRNRNTGGINTKSRKMLGDNRAVVNSLGEGAMWVANTNGNLVSGDYITSSNVAGYGQKQDDDFLHNYTVAKITMDCDFNPQEVPVQVIKEELDSRGRLQWEDHPTETEKAYKIRYLDASGQQTDEANAVHIAAFVGCTYHCG
jgi:hypothetical protein